MNKLIPEFSIEVAKHGYLLCSIETDGIPMSAMTQLAVMMPGVAKGIIDPGISHHYKYCQKRRCVMAICTKAAAVLWRKEIEEYLADFSHKPEAQWWYGLDVGASSAAIFAVLARDMFAASDAERFARGATPLDSEDFGRCVRLVNKMEWRHDLHRVSEFYSEHYKDSRWPRIIENWDTLCAMSPEDQRKFLQS